MKFSQPDAPRLLAVVFDLDGLMFNTEQLYQEVDRAVLARRGKDFSNELCDRMMGRKSTEAIQTMIDWHDLDETIEELASEIAELFAELLPRRVAPMPGLMPLLDALETAAISKAIATSSGRAFVGNVLSQFSLEPRFEFVLTSENIIHGKPAPDVYQLAAERLGVCVWTPVGALLPLGTDHFRDRQFEPQVFGARTFVRPLRSARSFRPEGHPMEGPVIFFTGVGSPTAPLKVRVRRVVIFDNGKTNSPTDRRRFFQRLIWSPAQLLGMLAERLRSRRHQQMPRSSDRI